MPGSLSGDPVPEEEVFQENLWWIKPNLQQFEFKGSRNHNALLLPDRTTQHVAVIKDELDSNPQRRYKMAYNAHNGTTWVFRTGTSPDGRSSTSARSFFRAASQRPIIRFYLSIWVVRFLPPRLLVAIIGGAAIRIGHVVASQVADIAPTTHEKVR